ncbi:hypothetical protein Ahy_B09g097624 isoform B [Arachis hypogaea]|uniref:Uncharacterized protein n=1 Tax=Arachis hypogaea TaxID=3818 RepID=A0A444XPX2_ARAHY|nr:hypothetical protein Ahy_B09g097624 isoform B [Arachis hypogaea]
MGVICWDLRMLQNVTAVDIGRLLFRGLENNGEDENCEFAAALVVFFLFAASLFYIYLTMPASGRIKLPRTLSDLHLLKENLLAYASKPSLQLTSSSSPSSITVKLNHLAFGI